jgi:hypothetical protein
MINNNSREFVAKCRIMKEKQITHDLQHDGPKIVHKVQNRFVKKVYIMYKLL